jgi:hypothetical protein
MNSNFIKKRNMKGSALLFLLLLGLFPCNAQENFYDIYRKFLLGIEEGNDTIVAEEGEAIIDIVIASGYQWDSILTMLPVYTASAFENLGKIDKAINYALLSEEKMRGLFGYYSWEVASRHNYLGTLYAKRGEVNSAISCMKAILGIVEVLVGKKHEYFYNTLGAIAVKYTQVDSVPLALEYFEKQYEIIESLALKDSLSLSVCTFNLARMYQSTGAMDRALLVNKKSVKDLNQTTIWSEVYNGTKVRLLSAIGNTCDLQNCHYGRGFMFLSGLRQ